MLEIWWLINDEINSVCRTVRKMMTLCFTGLNRTNLVAVLSLHLHKTCVCVCLWIMSEWMIHRRVRGGEQWKTELNVLFKYVNKCNYDRVFFRTEHTPYYFLSVSDVMIERGIMLYGWVEWLESFWQEQTLSSMLSGNTQSVQLHSRPCVCVSVCVPTDLAVSLLYNIQAMDTRGLWETK